jgi:hypothetical protein
MRPFVLLLSAASLFAQGREKTPKAPDNPNNENQYRQRGQTRPADESQSWTRGRLGTQKPIPEKSAEHTGILIDASCDDRTALNLSRAPEQPDLAPSPGPSRPKGSGTPPAGAPDVVARQPDRSCSITGSTRGYALLTPEGRLLNLDEGGNTFVTQALPSNPAGRAMLNGSGPGLKPQATLRGRVQGDRLIVEKILKL